MPLYKVDEIKLKDEKDSYYITHRTEEIEIKLNTGFTIAKNLIDYISQIKPINNSSFNIVITYKNEHLTYNINTKDESTTLDNTIILNCKLSETIALDQPKEVSRRLYGGILPLVLKDRDENLVDELVKTLPKENFSIEVILNKCDYSKLKEYKKKLRSKIEELSQEFQINLTKTEHIGKSLKQGLLGGETKSYQIKNIEIQKELELLENEYNALLNHGVVLEEPKIIIKADKKYILGIITSKISAFSEQSGALSNYKIKAHKHDKVPKFVPSNYIAALLALPTSEIPGIKVKKDIEFGVDIDSALECKETLTLGKLYKNNQTGIDINIPIKDLTKHTFITGVTGSGKTSTMKSLLLDIDSRNIPFLVLEPAKREYQFMKNKIPNLKRYTLGIESPMSFRLNPFQFPENIHIQTHLDHLKSVFIAAFPMYGPMPYILETALYNIYIKTGWDLTSSYNIYEGKIKERYRLFPTLEDLYLALDEVTDSIGYSRDLESDVKGALKVRIGSLLAGAKGLMLNTSKSNSIKELLKNPTVIELEYIGDNQEKVFLMGLLLISIYEQYISDNNHSDTLKNLLVIEEAHRLLENTVTSNNNEISDMKGKALETFNNILSEIRTYGQGIVIADQIPSKLSPDVIKNTNIKIIHRLFAEDDRNLVGNSIGLDEDQIKELINLELGYGVVFSSSIREPMKIKVSVDKEVLAVNHIGSNIKSQSAINKVSYILQNDFIKVKIEKTILSCILYPILEEKVRIYLETLGKKYFSEENLKLDEDEVNSIIIKIIEKKFKTLRFNNKLNLNYLQENHIIEDIKNSTNPLISLQEKFLGIESIYSHPMEKFVENYKKISFLADVLDMKFDLLNLVKNNLTNFKTNKDNIIKDIIEESNIDKFIEIDLLNMSQKRSLADSIVLYTFKNNDKVLKHYFDVKNYLDVYNTLVHMDNDRTENNVKSQDICEALGNLTEVIKLLNTKILKTSKIKDSDKNVDNTYERFRNISWIPYVSLVISIVAIIMTIVKG